MGAELQPAPVAVGAELQPDPEPAAAAAGCLRRACGARCFVGRGARRGVSRLVAGERSATVPAEALAVGIHLRAVRTPSHGSYLEIRRCRWRVEWNRPLLQTGLATIASSTIRTRTLRTAASTAPSRGGRRPGPSAAKRRSRRADPAMETLCGERPRRSGRTGTPPSMAPSTEVCMPQPGRPRRVARSGGLRARLVGSGRGVGRGGGATSRPTPTCATDVGRFGRGLGLRAQADHNGRALRAGRCARRAKVGGPAARGRGRSTSWTSRRSSTRFAALEHELYWGRTVDQGDFDDDHAGLIVWQPDWARFEEGARRLREIQADDGCSDRLRSIIDRILVSARAAQVEASREEHQGPVVVSSSPRTSEAHDEVRPYRRVRRVT